MAGQKKKLDNFSHKSSSSKSITDAILHIKCCQLTKREMNKYKIDQNKNMTQSCKIDGFTLPAVPKP